MKLHPIQSNFWKSNCFFIVAFLLATVCAIEFSCSSKHVNRKGTIDNFKKNEKPILALSDYFLKLKTDSNEVFFECHSNRYTISIGLPNWAVSRDHPYKVGRDMKLKSTQMDTFLKTLGWTTHTVLILKDMLNKANCESISSQGDYYNLIMRPMTFVLFTILFQANRFLIVQLKGRPSWESLF